MELMLALHPDMVMARYMVVVMLLGHWFILWAECEKKRPTLLRWCWKICPCKSCQERRDPFSSIHRILRDHRLRKEDLWTTQ